MAEEKKETKNDEIVEAEEKGDEKAEEKAEEKKAESEENTEVKQEVKVEVKEEPIKVKVERKRRRDDVLETALLDDDQLPPLKRKFEDETPPVKFFRASKMPSSAGYECPFLDQINRRILDFDNRKLCSETMGSLNVYACLVCGKYFQGRTRGTPAYSHALKSSHKMYIHLADSRIFCLPEDYEIKDATLGDIKHNLHPTFTGEEIKNLDVTASYSHALDGNDFLPGVLGFNDIADSHWCNSVVQGLLKVQPLRNFFIKKENYEKVTDSELVHKFGELVRKYHNPRGFKNHISPHELLQAVLDRSQKRFEVGKNCDPLDFMSWFLHALHEDLGGSKKKVTIISDVFQGQVRADTTEIPGKPFQLHEYKHIPFMHLLLDLPEMPLFKDGHQEKFIPQCSLTDLLNKFDGNKFEAQKDGAKRFFRLSKLPKYLIVSFRRFTEGVFSVEKNTTIVNCVIKGLDLNLYTIKPEDYRAPLNQLEVPALKAKLKKLKGNPNKHVEKGDFVQAVIDCKRKTLRKKKKKFDLIANVIHYGHYKQGTNKSFAFNQANQQWYDMHDLHVEETIPQLVSVAESYIQIWKRR